MKKVCVLPTGKKLFIYAKKSDYGNSYTLVCKGQRCLCLPGSEQLSRSQQAHPKCSCVSVLGVLDAARFTT